jgi:hypothetical protein
MKTKYCRACQCAEPFKGRKFCIKCIRQKEKEKRLQNLAIKKLRKEQKIKKKKEKRKEKKENSVKYFDTLWSSATKIYYGNSCEVCGKKENLNSHHLFSRSNFSIRWDYRNAVILCTYHHIWDVRISGHKAPAELLEFLKQKRGMEWYNDLLFRARQQKVDKLVLIAELKVILQKIDSV